MASNQSNIDFGTLCENLAADFLLDNGYKVIAKNMRMGRGEIDLIATIDQTICFIEVKASCSLAFGLPEERVNLKKQRQLIKLAKLFLQKNRNFQYSFDPRFDVISVIKNKRNDDSPCEIYHLIDAFRL